MPDPAPPPPEQLVIERDGSRVLLILNLRDEYEAMATYDNLIWQAREGFVLLDVETVTDA